MIEPTHPSRQFVHWQSYFAAWTIQRKAQSLEIWAGKLYIGACWGRTAAATRWERRWSATGEE